MRSELATVQHIPGFADAVFERCASFEVVAEVEHIGAVCRARYYRVAIQTQTTGTEE